MFIFALQPHIAMKQGLVFNIEEFAINDGPGIRKTVFLKGCPLRCAWCHNPEGLSGEPQIMHGHDGDEVCGRLVSSDELAESLIKDKDFFQMNGGGVTFTGGEPTRQADFLLEVLAILKGKVHTAIETSGFCAEDVFRKILELTDYVLFDIKAVDNDIHRKYTGVDNTLILRNFKTLSFSGKPFVARIPLIPGVNDSLEAMMAVRDLVEGAPGLERVEILRYHKTAGAKYHMVDREYDPPFDTDAVPEIHDVFKHCIIL